MLLFVEYIVEQKEWDRRFGLVKIWDLNHSCISQSSVCVRIIMMILFSKMVNKSFIKKQVKELSNSFAVIKRIKNKKGARRWTKSTDILPEALLFFLQFTQGWKGHDLNRLFPVPILFLCYFKNSIF